MNNLRQGSRTDFSRPGGGDRIRRERDAHTWGGTRKIEVRLSYEEIQVRMPWILKKSIWRHGSLLVTRRVLVQAVKGSLAGKRGPTSRATDPGVSLII